MTHIVKVARHGAITIPAELRKKHGISDGSYLGIEESDKGIMLVKLKIEKAGFEEVAEEMARIADEKGITHEDVIKASKKAGKTIYEEEFGD